MEAEENSSAKPITPAAVEWIPVNYFAPIDLAGMFGRTAPLELDIGCGDGAFLAQRAVQFPERNFLGLERLLGRVRTACKKSARQNLPNVRVLRIDLIYACRHSIPPGAVAMAHLLFPDPWPKSKHRRRRIVTAEFFDNVHDLLEAGGRFRIVTDNEKYFASIRQTMPTEKFREEISEELFPLTTFEKHYADAGTPIHRLELRKNSCPRNDLADHSSR